MFAFLKFILLIFFLFLVAIIWIAYSFFRQIRRSARRFRPEEHQDGSHVNGNTIIDNRTTEQRNKKVISDDEGEYIDFTISDKQDTDKAE